MLTRFLKLLCRGLGHLIGILLVLWGALAIYYSNLPSHQARLLLAAAFAGISIWALWVSHHRRAKAIFLTLFLAVAAWWFLIPPSHDRPWRAEVAVMPRAYIDGDKVRLTGVRNFDYRSRNDFTVRYEDRELNLSHLTGLDFFVSYWREGWVAHTFVSFTFDNAPPLTISIETRPEVGEAFDQSHRSSNSSSSFMWWARSVIWWAFVPIIEASRSIFIGSIPRPKTRDGS